MHISIINIVLTTVSAVSQVFEQDYVYVGPFASVSGRNYYFELLKEWYPFVVESWNGI